MFVLRAVGEVSIVLVATILTVASLLSAQAGFSLNPRVDPEDLTAR